MKPLNQSTNGAKAHDQAAKAVAAMKGGKSVASKTASRSRRSSRVASKRGASQHSGFGEYSKSAARLIGRGRNAIGDAYAWAGEASSGLPRAARNLGLPSQRSLQVLIEDNPLILGAVGLGIGVVLGTMLPSASRAGNFVSGGNGKSPSSRKSRRK